MCTCFVFLCKPQLGILTHPVTTVYIDYFCFILRCTHVCWSVQTLHSSKYSFFFLFSPCVHVQSGNCFSFLIKMIAISYIREISYLCVMDFRKLVLSVSHYIFKWVKFLLEHTTVTVSVYLHCSNIMYRKFCKAEIFTFEHPSLRNFFL